MNNNFKMNLPKIGIRPTIDGRRRGVRESMEEKTMDMDPLLPKAIWRFNGT